MTLRNTETVKTVLIGLVTYIAMIFLIILHKNSYRLLEFCGSYRDFHSYDTAPTVCLTMPEYFSKALIHPDFILPASVIALILSLGYYGKIWKIVENFKN